MTREDKELLLKDLCAKLPYGIIAYASEINKNGIITDVNIPYNMVNLTVDNASGKYELVPLSDIKPYLRPMSSMTEEEKEELYAHYCKEMADNLTESNMSWEIRICVSDAFGVDWLNKNMFDYRGLIPMGLALEAPDGMYKID